MLPLANVIQLANKALAAQVSYCRNLNIASHTTYAYLHFPFGRRVRVVTHVEITAGIIVLDTAEL